MLQFYANPDHFDLSKFLFHIHSPKMPNEPSSVWAFMELGLTDSIFLLEATECKVKIVF